MLKLGVIGTNIITDQMLDAAKTTGKYELTAVYSRTLEHAEKFGKPYGAAEFYDDIDKFFEVVDSCDGKVELVTGEGDRLNLKSKLSQYVSLANIFSGGEIPELEIVAYEKEDIDKLMSFMING